MEQRVAELSQDCYPRPAEPVAAAGSGGRTVSAGWAEVSETEILLA